jgi:uncharacterized cupredoxin-like copper-binding protein
MRRAASSLVLVGAVAAVVTASGCGDGARSARGATVVPVRVADFRIQAPAHVRAGNVVFRVHNGGPDAHEFIVIRSSRELPLRGDGVTVDEDRLEKVTAGTLEPTAPGSTTDLSLHLAPGRYELICNMNGHYLGGMRRQIVVS